MDNHGTCNVIIDLHVFSTEDFQEDVSNGLDLILREQPRVYLELQSSCGRKKLVVENILPVCSWCVECTTTPQPTSLLGPQEEVLMPLGELLSLEDGDQGVFALAGPSPDLLGRHFTDGPAKPNCNCYSIIHAQAISLILSRSNFNGIQ